MKFRVRPHCNVWAVASLCRRFTDASIFIRKRFNWNMVNSPRHIRGCTDIFLQCTLPPRTLDQWKDGSHVALSRHLLGIRRRVPRNFRRHICPTWSSADAEIARRVSRWTQRLLPPKLHAISWPTGLPQLNLGSQNTTIRVDFYHGLVTN